MAKTIFEQRGGVYHQQGDHLLPDLTVPENISVGVWGQRHLRYLKEHRKALYTSLQLSGELAQYLANIDLQAQEQFDLLVRQIAERQGIDEKLKAVDQMAWVGAMNNIRNTAEKIILDDLVDS